MLQHFFAAIQVLLRKVFCKLQIWQFNESVKLVYCQRGKMGNHQEESSRWQLLPGCRMITAANKHEYEQPLPENYKRRCSISICCSTGNTLQAASLCWLLCQLFPTLKQIKLEETNLLVITFKGNCWLNFVKFDSLLNFFLFAKV